MTITRTLDKCSECDNVIVRSMNDWRTLARKTCSNRCRGRRFRRLRAEACTA